MNAKQILMQEAEAAQTASAPTPAKAPKAKPAKKTAKKTAKPAKKATKAKKPAKKAAKSGEVTGPAVLRQYAPNYVKDAEKKTAGGNTSIDCGDDLAKKLRGKSLDEVFAFAAKTLDEAEKDLRKKYAHLNVGMQRMNLGNRVRAVLNAK